MNPSGKYLIPLVMVTVLTGLLTMGAAPFDKPEKEPIDKIVFVHYPKVNLGKGSGKPGGGTGGTGILCSDYKYSGYKWADSTAIPYYINPTGSGAGSTETIAALEAAMDTWSNASNILNFSYVEITDKNAGGQSDNYNVISWADISASYPRAIAVTTTWYTRGTRRIVEVDTQMNSALDWSITSPNISPDLTDPAVSDSSRYANPGGIGGVGYDIQNIMTHEAGHWIMLNDLYNDRDSELTMYGYGSLAEIKKDTLAYGDELGVEAVYGP